MNLPSASFAVLALAAVSLAGCSASGFEPPEGPPSTQGCTFRTTGHNPLLILEPGWTVVLEGEEDGESLRMVISVRDETRTVGGVLTRVVLEEEYEGGELVERSWNFMAHCEETGDVFYFGEEVDEYEGGELVSHSGEWLAGQEGALPGIMMPGDASVGVKHYQEYAPDQAMDHAEIVAVGETVLTPAGSFDDAVKVKEGNPLDGEVEYKWYAPEVGVIVDESMRLVQYGMEA